MDEDAKHLWMNKNILFLLVVGIFIIGIVSAAQITNFYFERGFTIVSSPQTYLKQNQDFQINFFLYNTTTGSLIDNSSANCTFYLADNYGSVLLLSDVPYFEEDYWGLNITGGNFSSTGEYNYGIKCEGAEHGGAIIGAFDVTPTGNGSPTSGEGMIFLGSLIAMLLAAATFIFLSVNVREHEGARFGFVSLAVIVCMIIVLYSSVALSETFWGFEKIISSYSTFLWVFLFVILIIFIFVLIATIVRALDSMKIKKGLKES